MDNQSSSNNTPSKFLENIRECVTRKNMQASPFYCLPNHTTPPSRYLKIQNPFEAALNERLHLHVFSPSVFTEVDRSRTSEKFKWTIDDVSSLRPAHIDESTIAQFELPNSEDDVHVQAKIEKFFSKTLIVPSPWNQESNPVPLLTQTESPPHNIETETPEMCNVWTQTILSLPPKLPEEVEKVLLPYFTFNEDQRRQSVDLNSSLCRRLFRFESPSGSEESLVSSIRSDLSEVGSPMMPDNTDKRKRTFDESPDADLIPSEISPITNSTPNHRKLSDCQISPISLNLNISDMQFRSVIQTDDNDDVLSPVCLSKKTKNQSFAKLDSSGHMSVDTSFNMVPENDVIHAQNSTDLSESPLQGNEFMDSSCNWDVEYNQISITNRLQTRRNLFEPSTQVESMDISNLTTPKSKCFISQRKKLSNSFKFSSENLLDETDDFLQSGEKSRFLQNCEVEPPEDIGNYTRVDNTGNYIEYSSVDTEVIYDGVGKEGNTHDTGYITGGDLSEKLTQSQFDGATGSDVPDMEHSLMRSSIFASTPSKRYFYDVGK